MVSYIALHRVMKWLARCTRLLNHYTQYLTRLKLDTFWYKTCTVSIFEISFMFYWSIYHHHHPRISSWRKSWNETSGPQLYANKIIYRFGVLYGDFLAISLLLLALLLSCYSFVNCSNVCNFYNVQVVGLKSPFTPHFCICMNRPYIWIMMWIIVTSYTMCSICSHVLYSICLLTECHKVPKHI